MNKLRLINGEEYIIPIDDEDIRGHLENSANCSKQIFEQFSKSYYNKFITPEDKIILDLGGNVGFFALHVSPFAEKIVSVEPTPVHFNLMKKITKDFKNIFPLNAAISYQTGKQKFYFDCFNTTMNSLIDRSINQVFSFPYYEAQTYFIKDLFEEAKLDVVDFVKIDIEGSEALCVNQAMIQFLKKKAKKVFLEVHDFGNGVQVQDNTTMFAQLFTHYGFDVVQFSFDGIFCKNK